MIISIISLTLTIAFYVMMLHVVVIVRIPGVPKQGFQHVGKNCVKQLELLCQNAVIVDVVVHHQRERPDTPSSEGEVYDSMSSRRRDTGEGVMHSRRRYGSKMAKEQERVVF